MAAAATSPRTTSWKLLSTNARTLPPSVARCRRLTEASLRTSSAVTRSNLTHLDLSECAMVTDETLACVARAPNLETLSRGAPSRRRPDTSVARSHLSLERCGGSEGPCWAVSAGRDPSRKRRRAVRRARDERLGPRGRGSPRREKREDEEGTRRRRGVMSSAFPRSRRSRRSNAEPGVVQLCLGRRHATLGGLKALRKLVLAGRAGRGGGGGDSAASQPGRAQLDRNAVRDDALAVLTVFPSVSKPGRRRAR